MHYTFFTLKRLLNQIWLFLFTKKTSCNIFIDTTHVSLSVYVWRWKRFTFIQHQIRSQQMPVEFMITFTYTIYYMTKRVPSCIPFQDTTDELWTKFLWYERNWLTGLYYSPLPDARRKVQMAMAYCVDFLWNYVGTYITQSFLLLDTMWTAKIAKKSHHDGRIFFLPNRSLYEYYSLTHSQQHHDVHDNILHHWYTVPLPLLIRLLILV